MVLRSIATCCLAFGLILTVAFGFKLIGGVSRLWLLASAAGVVAWVVGSRVVLQRLLLSAVQTEGRCLDRALIMASSARAARRVGAAIENESRLRIRVAAAVALPGLPGAPSMSWIEYIIRSGLIDRVMIADFEQTKDETNATLSRLVRLAVNVTLIPNVQGLCTPIVRSIRIGWISAVDVATRPLSAGQALIKRIEDLIVGSLALVFTLPLMVAAAILIKLDSPGPVLFRQQRVGFHDKTFPVFKFRTMYHDMADHGSVRQTSRRDSRVTRVGRFLRKTSIDELPQLFNVLRGEMSVIGPRPHALNMTAAGLPLHEVLDDYTSRHRIKPGITGWAQINGCRGEIDSEEKLRKRIMLDSYYIESWSLALDAWILIRTAVLVAIDRQAY